MKGTTLLTGVFISILLTGSSIYISLKLGALPWPAIFCAIIAYTLLRNRDLREINIAEAGGTTGALVGAAAAFTLPAIWFMNESITLMDALTFSIVLLLASLTGIFLSSSLREKLLDSLPFPEGQATAEMLRSMKVRRSFFVALSLAGIFALLRDLYIPRGYMVSFLGITLVFAPLLMGVGGGYIMGKKTSFSWFGGAILGWIILEPFLGISGSMVQNMGLGILLGSSIGFLASFVAKTKFSRTSMALAMISFFVLTLIGLNPLASFLAVAAGHLFAMVAFRMTGETNVDPLEQFGLVTGVIIFSLFTLLDFTIPLIELFIPILFVSCLAAVCGDIGHDFKAAAILGTDSREIVKMEVVSTIAASVVAPIFLMIIYRAYAPQFFTSELPAPQAQMVAKSLFGYEHPAIFLLSFVFAFFAQFLLKDRFLSLPALGIGAFLNLNLGILFFAGGMWRLMDERRGVVDIGIPSALLAGEGLAGFASAIMIVIGVPVPYAVFTFVLVFLLIFIKKIKP